VLQALREIAESAEIQGIVPNRDGKAYWTRLVDSLRPHAANKDLLAYHIYPDGMRWTSQSPERTHRFIIERQWDPYDLWFSHELQKPEVRSLYSYPWASQRGFHLQKVEETGKFRDPTWDLALERRYALDTSYLPAWYDTTYNGFVAAVARLWEGHKSESDSESDWEGEDTWSSGDPNIEVEEYLDETLW
jgi:hypothetical protein